MVEVLDHGGLSDIGDMVPHSLETLLERAEALIALVLDGFEVAELHRLVGKGLKICDKPVAEIDPVFDVMAGKLSEPLHRVLPKNDGQVRCHDILHCPGGPSGGYTDGQPATWVLLGLVLINV
jgi:RNAse (barnase) inhibitor barstar